MSKRYIFPEQHGEIKKAKLNVTISDHNFPLSQNAVSSKEANPDDNWGDDNDDEILLLASQACEDAYSDDINTLPDYSMCMQPPSTSTQMYDQPGPSKAGFTFKKPTANPPSAITTKLKDKCNRISSPLPGISKVVQQANKPYNLTDDLIVNEKIYKENGDSDFIYRQLLQLQEENTKLKSENGKLLEKCVTKEGEASILRTQLKTCQSAVDNARLERIKAQEKVQLEFADKLANIKKEMCDLKTQLDFKNVEIISIKEKCKKLESSKVKLTQVMVTGNDISASYRHNASMLAPNESSTHHLRRVKVEKKESSIQTEHKAVLLKLNKTPVSSTSKVTRILPLILEPSCEMPSMLASNEKLQRSTDRGQDRCRVFSTYHQLPAAPAPAVEPTTAVFVEAVHRDLTRLAAGSGDCGEIKASCCNLVNTTRTALQAVRCELEGISQRVSTAFLREMDERYVDATTTIDDVDELDLFRGSPLYNEEQAIVARRLVAALALVLEDSRSCDVIRMTSLRGAGGVAAGGECVVDMLAGVCKLLDSNYCALLYSGLLMSAVLLATNLVKIDRTSSFLPSILDIVRCVVTSRPRPAVCRPLGALLAALGRGAQGCPPGGGGDLRTDYEQGVLLYKSDSCLLQVFLRQTEVALKCMERRRLVAPAAAVTRDLIALHASSAGGGHDAQCDCQQLLIQVIIYGLSICTLKLDNESTVSPTVSVSEVEALCRAGVRLLWRGCARDAALAARCPGPLAALGARLRGRGTDALHENMLTELMGTFQSSPEELPSSFHGQAWVKSFESFSMAD